MYLIQENLVNLSVPLDQLKPGQRVVRINGSKWIPIGVGGDFLPSSSRQNFYLCTGVDGGSGGGTGGSDSPTGSYESFWCTWHQIVGSQMKYYTRTFTLQDSSATGLDRVWVFSGDGGTSGAGNNIGQRRFVNLKQTADAETGDYTGLNKWSLQNWENTSYPEIIGIQSTATDHPWQGTYYATAGWALNCQFSVTDSTTQAAAVQAQSTQVCTVWTQYLLQEGGTLGVTLHLTDQTLTGNDRVWQHQAGNYKLYFDSTDTDRWTLWHIAMGVVSRSLTEKTDPWSGDPIWMSLLQPGVQFQPAWQLTYCPGGAGTSDSGSVSVPYTWAGRKAVFNTTSNCWQYQINQTTGLTYSHNKPVVGSIYTEDALAQLQWLHTCS